MESKKLQLLNQIELRQWFKEVRGKAISNETLLSCLRSGMPYLSLGKRKLFNPEKVLEWMEQGIISKPRNRKRG